MEGTLMMNEGLYCVMPLYATSYANPIQVAISPENNAARIDLDNAGFSKYSSIINVVYYVAEIIMPV